MKELLLGAAGGEWRVAFAFDTKRKAILLVAGDKSGVSERRFYRELVRKADERFDSHLARLKKERRWYGRLPPVEGWTTERSEGALARVTWLAPRRKSTNHTGVGSLKGCAD